MSAEVKILIDKYEYDRLIEIEKEYNSKNFYCEIGFVLGRRFTPFFIDRFYYEKNDKIHDNVVKYSELLEDIIVEVENLIIPENKDQIIKETIFNKLMNWYNNKLKKELE